MRSYKLLISFMLPLFFLVTLSAAADNFDNSYITPTAPVTVANQFDLPYIGLGLNLTGLSYKGVVDPTNDTYLAGPLTRVGAQAYAGWGHIIRDTWYAGAELYGNYVPVKNTGHLLFNNGVQQDKLFDISSKWSAGGLVRAGYFPSINTLVYFLVGADLQRFNVENIFYGSSSINRYQKMVLGAMPGVGMEVRLSHRFSLRLQYVYVLYPRIENSFATTSNTSRLASLSDSRFLLGVAYHIPMPGTIVNDEEESEPVSRLSFDYPYVGVSGDVVDFASQAEVSELTGGNHLLGRYALRRPNVGGTLFAGYNFKFFNRFYLGEELFLRYAPLKVDAIANSPYKFLKITNNYSFGGDIQPGILLTPNTLVYGLFGIDVANFKMHYEHPSALSSPLTVEQKYAIGYMPGIGIQTALSHHFALRMQYAYVFYPGNINGSASQGGTTFKVDTHNLSKSIFSLGLVCYIPD